MAAAPALEAAVMRRLAALALLCAATPLPAAMHVVVIGGLGGEPQFEERFMQWSERIAGSAATATGSAQTVHRFAGAAARREAIDGQLRQLATQLAAGDQFVLVLLGHGSYDGNEYRFNIPGPDLTGSELLALLDRFPATVPQLVVNATSASGAVAERWQRPHRIVVTATRSGGERVATRFGGFWAEALASEEADRDKDGRISAQEAYEFASRRVEDAYKADAAIATEHARMMGGDAANFIVARLGDAALFAGDSELAALRAEQDAVERRVDALRAQKLQLAEDDYYARLESILVEMARLGGRIDARLAALGRSAEQP
ncbi:MAG: hypothetical protein QM696_09285 [Steroidobacteraceae bacterium]